MLCVLLIACGNENNDELTDLVYQDFQNIISIHQDHRSQTGTGVDSVLTLLNSNPNLKITDPWGSLYFLNSIDEITLYSLGPDKTKSGDDIYYKPN